MFRRELKVNLKSAIIWLGILASIYVVVILVYPYIIDGENVSMMKDMMALFPQEILKAFNMDIALIDTAFGWVKSEGFVFILLVVSCYSGILGSSIVLKEENDKTIEYLVGLPISRIRIVVSKILVGLIYIVGMVVLLGIINFVALSIAGDFDYVQYILLSITPLFPALVIYFVCMFISTFTHKSKSMLGVSLGITLLSYIIHIISTISTNVEFLKYFSVFTLADIRNVIIDVAINPIHVVVTLVLASIFALATIIRYNHKELV